MAKQHDDQYWMDLINRCRTSGLTDYEWCCQNNIPSSTFYYHVKMLRRKACSLPDPASADTSVKQDVVQVFMAPEETNLIPSGLEQPSSFTALRINFQGICLELTNEASEKIIASTLRVLQSLC